MPFSNLTLMRETRDILGPHWGLGVLVSFVFVLIVGAPSGVFPGTGELVPLFYYQVLCHLNLHFFHFQSFGKIAHILISCLKDSRVLSKAFGLPVHDDFDCCGLCPAHHPRNIYFSSTFDDFFGYGGSP